VKWNAIFGGAVWGLLAVAARAGKLDLNWIELLFLFAPLVIVPLGMELTRCMETGAAVSMPERVARAVQIPAAGLALAAFFCAPGYLAAGLACGWLAFCGLLAIGGVIRFVNGAYMRLDSACAAIAFIYIAVGGAWLVASRLGLTLIGFQEPIVLLTAVHFHYAGFAAPLLARSAGRALPTRLGGGAMAVLFRGIVTAVLLGPGILAAGFVIGPRVKLLTAIILAAAEIGLAISFLFALRKIQSGAAKFLIAISALSVVFSMAMAGLWAIGEYPLQPFVHLAEMARLHGTANAFGFTLCGLLGWGIVSARGVTQRSTQR
jgi:type III secretory pathway component EscS